MAIAFDTSTNGGLNPGNSTTWQWNHTTTTNNNRLMYVSVFGDASDVVTGVTYNSVSMTLIHKIKEPSGRWWYSFYLIAPATGTNEVQITSSASIRMAGSSATIDGAKQSGQPDAQNTNTGTGVTNISTSITVIAEDSWVFSGARSGASDWTAGTGLTMLQDSNGLFLAHSNGLVSSGASSYEYDNVALNTIVMGASSFAPVGAAVTFIPKISII